MKSANCPSCGAPVSFRAAGSLYAVCPYCRSTLVRNGEELADLGRMAELLDDPTLLQIGSGGRYHGLGFGVIGRLQLRYEAGLWNEWHVLFDDGRTGWLSEAGGEYVISLLVPVNEPIPPFAGLAPGQVLRLANRDFTVTDLETARCIAGEGELPFAFGAGYDAQTADLRQEGHFASIDYSETPPLVFMGMPVPSDDLHLSNLREKRELAAGGQATTSATALACPQCGAPLELHSGAILSVACARCGSLMDVADKRLQLIARAESLEQPRIPLGSKGRLGEVEWEVIGFLRRQTVDGGETFTWAEYLLFHPSQGFAWLTEDQGHWNFLRPLSSPPNVGRHQDRFKYEKQDYTLYNRGVATVTAVLGEFYWQVRAGESGATADFVSGSRMLCREITGREISWSGGEYLEPDVVWAAFGLKTPQPRRDAPYGNQPNPWAASHSRTWKWFVLLFLLAGAAHFGFFSGTSSSALLTEVVIFEPGGEESIPSKTFTLTETARRIHVRHQTSLDNNWLSLTTALVDKNSGQTWQGSHELSRYHGVDGGESWSEGSSEDELLFRDIPPGTYYLSLDPELGTDQKQAVYDTLTVERNPTVWSNYVLLNLFLVLFPLFSRWRRNAFESARWEESGIGSDSLSESNLSEEST